MNIEPVDIGKFKQVYRARNEGDFPKEIIIVLKKMNDLKYGENPNQHAAMYTVKSENGKLIPPSAVLDLTYVRSDEQGKGGLSQTNVMDICRATDVLKFFPDPAVVIMKHNIVSGFAKASSEQPSSHALPELFRAARDCDLRSNFGGTAVFNRPLDMETAEALFELKGESPFFVDVIAATEYEAGVIDYLQSRSKTIRIAKTDYDGILRLPKFVGDDCHGLYSLKDLGGGWIAIQDLLLTRIRSNDDFILRPMVADNERKYHIIETLPSEKNLDDLLTAWYLNLAGARSNGVVFVKDDVLVSMGSGQVERVGAVEQAIIKGTQKAMDRLNIKYDSLMGIAGALEHGINPFLGASCSSDGFFPFSDSVDLLARVGVAAVAPPYGSKNDYLVIDAANRHRIAMPATLERCFGHF